MKYSDKQGYEDWKEKNMKDPYGAAIFNYAEKWAELMEKEMENGHDIKDIAKATSHEADTEGITGFMYGAAVSILSKCWEHGEELRQWHNLDTQINNEGEEANKQEGAVINPAIMTVGKKD